MSNEKNPSSSPVSGASAGDLPQGIPPELVPLYDWWNEDGKKLVLILVVVGLAVGGFYAGRAYLRDRAVKANAALMNDYNADELEADVARYGSTKTGGALRLRLAKAYYDAGRYQDALAVYDKLVADQAAPEGFADIPVVGRAFALEGLGKFAEAHKAYADFASVPANTNSYLVLTARLGAARTTALLGDKAGAQKELDALKAKTTDRVARARIERLAETIKRYEPHAARSLFDAANAAQKALDVEKAPAVPAAVPAPTIALPEPAAAKTAPVRDASKK